jgi:putative endonuclease
MYSVYVLYSPDFTKSYVGCTANLDIRLASHNQLATSGWTVRFRPWVLVHTEFFHLKLDALQREKFLKSGQGRLLVKSIIQSWLYQHPS